jgi:predicted MFS family arabinose efflux permease
MTGRRRARKTPWIAGATEETNIGLPRAPMNAPAPGPGHAPARLPRASTSPFSQRNFRFQWPSDLAVSWAFEMEALLLAWFVLVETGSVIWLTAFGALQFVGTLISPLYGVAGDRMGQRRVLSCMRAAYVAQAACIAALALSGELSVAAVFIVAFFMGLVRPSDIGVRNALIAATMPAPLLAKAIGIERVSMDAARVVGALTGAGIVAMLGMGQAYVVVASLYLISLALTFGIREPSRDTSTLAPASLVAIWQELGAGIAYARRTPALMAALFLACLANFAAYPLTGGLLPHVAREVYQIDQTGLGMLFACFSGGAVLGSLLVSLRGVGSQPARVMLGSAALWFAFLLVFAHVEIVAIGMALLMVTGFLQSLCMVPMSVLILRITAAAFRGRVMGLRMLAIYGLPVGLLLTGLGIAKIGFPATATLLAGFGLLATLAIAWHWRADLWRMPPT